jgi:uncharacterized protein
VKLRSFLRVSAGLVAIAFAGLCVMSWIISGALTRPRNSQVDLSPDITGESLVITTSDNIRLAGTFLAGNGTNACVLVLHGNGTSRAGVAHVMRMLQSAGYGVMAIDFRGHGASQPTQSTAGYDERLDANAGFDAMQAKCPNRKTAIYGFSLGGAAALLGTAAERTDALILDAVYSDIVTAVSVRINRVLGKVGDVIVTPVLMLALEIRTGIDPQEMRPVDAAVRVMAPTLLLAGGADDRAPVSGSQAMQARMRGKTQLIVVPGADHGAISFVMGAEFSKTILTFLEQLPRD